jgi:hypothetical protein
MPDKQSNEELFEFEMLKQRYESLEKTLANVEKEKDYYQVDFVLFLFHQFFFFSFVEKL